MLEGDDPREALDGFKQVVAMEQEKGEWCVRAAWCACGGPWQVAAAAAASPVCMAAAPRSEGRWCSLVEQQPAQQTALAAGSSTL
jgi:hypothetical protein